MSAIQRPHRPHHKRHRRAQDTDGPEEKRPKVNPIFLWASQREQRIVEVRCEDYDKRNRIKLTKTAQGWRSIPRTTVVPATPTPDKKYRNGGPDADDAAMHHGRHHRRHHLRSTRRTPSREQEEPGAGVEVEPRLLLLQPRVILQQLRPSQLTACTSAVDQEDIRRDELVIPDAIADLPDSPTHPSPPAEVPNRPHCRRHSFRDTDGTDGDPSSSSRILDALRNTPGLSVSIADTVEIAPAESVEFSSWSASSSSSSPLRQRRGPPPGLLISVPGSEPESESSRSYRRAPVPALMSRLSISIPSYRYRPRSGGEPVSCEKLDSDSPESGVCPKVETEDPDDSRSQGAVLQASPQPSGIPCSPAAGARPASVYLERLLPSPPCSVSCSEDARNDLTLKGILASPSQHHRHPLHLQSLQLPPEANNNAEPATELRELLRVSGHLVPDPLLVPRDFLPALAAAPATEIPRLLASRPELRLPHALTRPDLLRDPDLLVISLAHLQHVLDHGEGPTAVDQPRPKLSCKPIGTLMPAPIDLSSANRERLRTPTGCYPVLRVRTTGLLKQESEVTSTAASPEDSNLWHPLFGSQKRHLHHQHEQQRELQLQQPPLSQTQQQQQRNHASWHRASIAS